jgi:methylglutaconyl-CoA hydratase
MTKKYETILLDIEKGMARLTLNRPELHNAFNEIMIAELTSAFSALSKDPQVRVVVLTGAGHTFCAGADLNWMKKMAGNSRQQNLADAKKLHKMFATIYLCSKPVISYVNGSAHGGGVGLVAASDMALADLEAVFSFSEVRLGLIPAVIAPFIIRKIGEANARECFLTGERFSALRAREMGLIHYQGASDQVREKVTEKISLLKLGAPGALADCKKLLEKLSATQLEKMGMLTSQMIAARRASKEGQEGMVAFLTKRTPNWVLE